MWDDIFPNNFPVWEGETCQGIAVKTLLWYWMQEIGCETVGLWKLHVRSWVNVNAPKFVSLSKSIQSGGVVAGNSRYMSRSLSENIRGTNEASHRNTGVNSGGVNELISDTPQNGLEDVIAGKYLTGASVTQDNRTVTDEGEANQTQNSNRGVTESVVEMDMKGGAADAINSMMTMEKAWIVGFAELMMSIL